MKLHRVILAECSLKRVDQVLMLKVEPLPGHLKVPELPFWELLTYTAVVTCCRNTHYANHT